MKAVIQRVSKASVTVNSEVVGSIETGFLVLLGIELGDTDNDRDYLVNKISKLRIFSDEYGKMNLDINQVNGNALIISQFTLLANTKKGNRPSYINSEKPEIAEKMYLKFCDKFSESIGQKVKKGIFGADMQVSLLNDGPVTIILNSRNR